LRDCVVATKQDIGNALFSLSQFLRVIFRSFGVGIF
jgi:hypothetical protein